MCKANYSRSIFIHNIEVLIKYNWEPEVEIFLTNKTRIMIVVYKDFVDYINTEGKCIKCQNIIEALSLIKWNEIETINSLNGIDFSIPIERQSIFLDGVLWLTKN